MALSVNAKTEIINNYRRSENDTGSPEVQVALLTERIRGLTDHFKEHKHDHHSRKGLLRMVNRRRKLLAFVKSENPARYQELITRLNLRK